MENRFGVRDLIISVLLLVLIAVVLLAMVQYDRQWDELRGISVQLREQTRELSRIRTLLEGGVRISGDGRDATGDITQPPAFARIEAAAAREDYALGDYFVDVFAVVPDRLTPLISSDAYASMVQQQVLQSLAQRDPQTLEWEPLVASGWQISDDGLVITFQLRRGVTFSDGESLTADDVVFTFHWMMNEAIEAPRARAYYDKIERVEKLDDYSVAFHFHEPYFQAFELAAGMEILPEHFYSRFTPSQFNRATGLLLGSGPYRLPDPEGWRPEPGRPIELVRNDRYWGPPAPFDRRIYRVIENDTARLTTFRNGDLDAFYPTPEQYLGMRQDEQLLARTHQFEFQRPNAGYLYIAWNQRRGGEPTVFADIRVRQAMTMLTDRQRICDEMYYGYAQPVTGPFSPLSRQYDHDIDPWPFDPSRARELLAEAGFTARGRDGVLVSADGQPLRFRLSYPANSETFNRVVLFIKDTFARAGVIVDPDPLEWSVLIERINQRNYDAVSLGWTGSVEGDLFQIFHSSQIEGTADNFTSYRNPQLDALIDEARATVDEETRLPLWQAAHRVLHEDQPYTFLLTRQTLAFFDHRLRNIEQVTLGLNSELEWYVPAALRKWSP
jgi:peptide/nickel transport system substrate-binding protein